MIFIIISPKAQKKNKMAFDFCLKLPPIISFEQIKTIEKNISIPAQLNVFPIVIQYMSLEINDINIPIILKYQANIKTFFLPILSDNTPKTNAENPAIIIKNP